jgi:hypothetical protein
VKVPADRAGSKVKSPSHQALFLSTIEQTKLRGPLLKVRPWEAATAARLGTALLADLCPDVRQGRRRAYAAAVLIKSKRAGDRDHLKVFADPTAAEAWFKANDPEGVAFEYEVISQPMRPHGR